MEKKTLDEIIRHKAGEKASAKFWQDVKALLDNGHSGTWCANFKYEDYDALRKLLKRFYDAIHVPAEQQKAINAFYANYQNLIVRYPELQVEEGVNG